LGDKGVLITNASLRTAKGCDETLVSGAALLARSEKPAPGESS
jgi:hypothetical protein